MMRPHLAFIIERMADRQSSIDEVILTASTSSQSSSFIRMNRLSRVMPALFTRISTGPASSVAVSIIFVTASRSERSAGRQ